MAMQCWLRRCQALRVAARCQWITGRCSTGLENTMNTKRVPIDFNLINIGDTIPIDVLETALKCDRRLAEFNIKVMNLAGELSQFLSQKHGRFIAVAQVKRALRVLTDQERVDYHEREMKAGRRKLQHGVYAMRNIDTTVLSAQDQQKLDRQILIGSMELVSMRSIRRNLPRNTKPQALPTP